MALRPGFAKTFADPGIFARVIGHALSPLAFAAYAFAAWRLAADLNLAGEFFISQGLLSRWQVWLVMAVAIQMTANYLNRFGRPDGRVTS